MPCTHVGQNKYCNACLVESLPLFWFCPRARGSGIQTVKAYILFIYYCRRSPLCISCWSVAISSTVKSRYGLCSFWRQAFEALWMLSYTGQSIHTPTTVLLHPHSACSAIQVSPFIPLLLYCCIHTLRAQLYRSVKLWFFCCIAASTVNCSSCTGHWSHCPSGVPLHPRLMHIAHKRPLKDQNCKQEVKAKAGS